MKFVPRARVAVIVPVHNRLAHTRGCIAELRKSDFREALVIVVDDGSSDGTAEYLREHHPDVVVLPGTGSLWWSGAANVGCGFALDRAAEVLILFNNDNLAISANCVTELVRCVDDLGGCACSVAIAGGGSQRLRHAGGSMNWPSRGITLREEGALYRSEARVVECAWLPGTSLAFSARLFKQLGGFDDRVFPHYRGDTDFTLRARALGKPCVVSYACWVRNDARESGLGFHSRVSVSAFVRGLFSLRSNYQVRSVVRFARRYCPPRLIPIYLILFYLRYAYASLKTWLPWLPSFSARG